MDVQLLTFIIVGASFALYIAIAIWARAGSTNDFYVAGGGVPPVLNGMATAADWMSAASFISMAGLISFMGYDGAVYLMGWTGGYVLLALCLAPYLRKSRSVTIPASLSFSVISSDDTLLSDITSAACCTDRLTSTFTGARSITSDSAL